MAETRSAIILPFRGKLPLQRPLQRPSNAQRAPHPNPGRVRAILGYELYQLFFLIIISRISNPSRRALKTVLQDRTIFHTYAYSPKLHSKKEIKTIG